MLKGWMAGVAAAAIGVGALTGRAHGAPKLPPKKAAPAASLDDRLFYAIDGADASRVKALIAKGAHARAKEPDGTPALVFAAHCGPADVVSALLDAGADINGASPDGTTPLIAGASGGRSRQALVKLLLDRGADLNARDKKGRTVVFFAPAMELGVLKLLVERGADPNAVDGIGATPLVSLLLNTPPDKTGTMVEFLLSRGARADGGPNAGAMTPLQAAAVLGNAAAVDPLLTAGAEIDRRGEGGATPLLTAAFYGQSKVVRTLLDAGADVTATDSQGETALILTIAHPAGRTQDSAAKAARREIARMLLGRHADVNLVFGPAHLTPLMVAANNGDPEMVNLLLGNGADPKAEAVDHSTALTLAAAKRNTAIVKLLKEAGATK